MVRVELDQLLRRIEEELKAGAFRYVAKIDYETGFWLEGEPELLQDTAPCGCHFRKSISHQLLWSGGETITAITTD